MEMDCILKNLALSFQSSRTQNQKCTMAYPYCKKSIDALVLNFKAMLSARVKVRKKDFCTVLAEKK